VFLSGANLARQVAQSRQQTD